MATDYQVDIKNMGGLTAHEFHELLKLRIDVFVVEQNCPYAELDGKDPEALHVRLLKGGELLAATRILKPKSEEDHVKIGRVVVSPVHRGTRLGEAVMKESIIVCEGEFPTHTIAISAQSHLQKFYGALGFSVISEEYIEDDIPHIDMVRNV